MKKKKTDYNELWNVIAVSCMIGIIILGIYIFAFRDNKPQFTIYKENCWNVSLPLTGDSLDEIECPSFFNNPKKVKCYDVNYNEIIGEKCLEYPPEHHCFVPKSQSHKDYLLYSEFLGNSIKFTWYQYQYFGQPLLANNQPTKTEQKCEKVEVEEIYRRCFNWVGDLIPCESVPKENIFERDRQTRENGFTYATKIFHNMTTDNYFAYFTDFISKKDLTKELLSQNCDFIIPKRCENIKDCEGYYKCGDYEVEVK